MFVYLFISFFIYLFIYLQSNRRIVLRLTFLILMGLDNANRKQEIRSGRGAF
jgi:hypothetical protein